MKKQKNIALYLLVIFSIISQGAGKKSVFENISTGNKKTTPVNNGVFGITDEVEIDLSNNTAVAPDGINLHYEGMKVKAFKTRRDTEKGKVYFEDFLLGEIEQGMTRVKIEAENGEISAKGDTGSFNNIFGYIEVGAITGAEAPNDKIFFGGNRAEYKNDIITIRKAWVTTDHKVANTSKATDAGYHISSDLITIEPDKQITLKKNNLYMGEKDVLPFNFPWYRVNIRNGSEVPLFPKWTSDSYYGWELEWGVLYGDQKSKYKGGISPKFADTMGLLIGRWENWYKTENFGTAKLNIDDLLVYSKADRSLKYTNPMEYEQKHRRYRFNYNHEYTGKYGYLNFDSIYGTQSMIPKLDDLINTYESRNWFNNASDAVPTKRPKYDDYIGFYTFDANLKGMGEKKDTEFKGLMKLTDNKRSYALMVYDQIDDIGYNGRVDNDLFTQLHLSKDNDKYKLGGYYNYLYDMDPGSTREDVQSRAEDFGFEFHEKKYNIGFSYDEKNGDKYRTMGLWERDPMLEPKVTVDSLLGTRFTYSYNPTNVREYVQYDSKDLRISLGEYKISEDYTLKIGVDSKEFVHELDTGLDSLRSGAVRNNSRDREYNRYNDILYREFKETRGYITIYNDEIKVLVAGGETKDKFITREGLYDGTSREYLSKSDFYEVLLEKNMINLKKAGELALSVNLRYDKYKEGLNPFTGQHTTGEDSSLRTTIDVNHIVELFNNKNNQWRTWDFSVSNDLRITYEHYSYDDGNVKFGNLVKDSGKTISSKEVRLKEKDNFYQIIDKIDIELGNADLIYTIDYKKASNPANSENLNSKTFKNTLEIKLDEKKKGNIYYNTDKHYTDERLDDINYNNLTYENYGGALNIGKHTLSYGKNLIESKIINMKNVDDANEKINVDSYGYGYKFKNNDTISFKYSTATDKRHNEFLSLKELDVDNRNYSVRYVDFGEIERIYAMSYGTYRHKEDGSKNLTLDSKRYNSRNADELFLSFEYRDKRLNKNDLLSYGKKEYNKSADELTLEELDKVKEILQNRQNQRNMMNFNLSRIRDEQYHLGDYRRNFKIWIRGERNKARYDKTGDYLKSLQEVNGGIFYSQNRFGLGYNIEINNGWQGKEWKKIDREHKISLHAKIGKPSEGWEIKTYGKFYENLNDDYKNIHRKKKALDGIGVEIGKEFGYYQWSVAYENDYNSSSKDYEWKVGIQFKLLTFPKNPVFHVGGKKDGDGKVSPSIDLFDGIKPEKKIED